VVAALAQATERLAGEEHSQAEQIMAESRRRVGHVSQFVTAYRQYCWPVSSLTDLRLAPFHLLASEGRVHTDKNHTWHMETLASVCRMAPDLLLATNYKLVDVTDPASVAGGTTWWTELTGRGGEGMVVKPLDFILRGKRGLAQPAVKCRGREYLRIIYGPDYTADENLSRLRSRGLGHKRSLALGEFALGIEGLERFVRREPLRRVHECVFGVLALESEPVDPRL
jgi:protein phosphatase